MVKIFHEICTVSREEVNEITRYRETATVKEYLKRLAVY